ncbi:hypothetical protein WISP_116855 [Willisornis vidua]|uniref:Uncharacterized protein n=1 Tax=Willisornis vidua TaxID=1566151 RepID=A0ABQ9CZ14_9PASS|nr:hypothetical protein WISP_116855 [Willisornis vidua]
MPKGECCALIYMKRTKLQVYSVPVPSLIRDQNCNSSNPLGKGLEYFMYDMKADELIKSWLRLVAGPAVWSPGVQALSRGESLPVTAVGYRAGGWMENRAMQFRGANSSLLEIQHPLALAIGGKDKYLLPLSSQSIHVAMMVAMVWTVEKLWCFFMSLGK